MNKKILFLNSNTHHLYGQQHLMQAFIKIGYNVVLLTPNDNNYFDKLISIGYDCIPLRLDSRSLNPASGVMLIFDLLRHFKNIQPDLVLSFTIKPNLFGAIASKILGIKFVSNITGLGYSFIKGGILSKVAVFLYKIAIKKTDYVFFQNSDDYYLLKKLNVIKETTCSGVIPGSGVDLEKFNYVGLPNSDRVVFMYLGRLLWDKGIGELIESFRLLKQRYPTALLVFVGGYFPANPAAIKPEELNRWINEDIITYLGMVDRVDKAITECSCMILPSYREGMPRSLLEASSMGKPIITVNSVGCKDVVEDGVTGYMARVKDVNSLAEAMIRFIELPFDKKVEMGVNGRRKMEREFDQKIVIDKYLEVAKKLLSH